jgi:hypothetical protein
MVATHGVASASHDVEATDGWIQEQLPLLEPLNGLSNPDMQWVSATARHAHTDIFGIVIPAGQRHFRKGEPLAFPLRLSEESMAKMLYVLFRGNRHGVLLGQAAQRKREDRLQEGADALASFVKPT